MAQKHVDPVDPDPQHCKNMYTSSHLAHQRGNVVEGGAAVGAPVLGSQLGGQVFLQLRHVTVLDWRRLGVKWKFTTTSQNVYGQFWICTI
jgi:hypothetical protein